MGRGLDNPSFQGPDQREGSLVTPTVLQARVEELLHLDPKNPSSWSQESYLDEKGLGLILVDTSRVGNDYGAFVRRHFALGVSGFVTVSFEQSEVLPEIEQVFPVRLAAYLLRVQDPTTLRWYGFETSTFSNRKEPEVEVAEGLENIIEGYSTPIDRAPRSMRERAEKAFRDGKPYSVSP